MADTSGILMGRVSSVSLKTNSLSGAGIHIDDDMIDISSGGSSNPRIELEKSGKMSLTADDVVIHGKSTIVHKVKNYTVTAKSVVEYKGKKVLVG